MNAGSAHPVSSTPEHARNGCLDAAQVAGIAIVGHLAAILAVVTAFHALNQACEHFVHVRAVHAKYQECGRPEPLPPNCSAAVKVSCVSARLESLDVIAFVIHLVYDARHVVLCRCKSLPAPFTSTSRRGRSTD